MLRETLHAFLLFLSVTLASPLLAAMPEPVTLAPMTLADGKLTLVTSEGETVEYTAEALEDFPTYALMTRTPWRETPARFEGVLLNDILEKHGLLDAEAIQVTAENDFRSTIEGDVFRRVPILVATRVDGKPHSRRARGPIQFVIDEEIYRTTEGVREGHLVWMAARIEAAE